MRGGHSRAHGTSWYDIASLKGTATTSGATVKSVAVITQRCTSAGLAVHDNTLAFAPVYLGGSVGYLPGRTLKDGQRAPKAHISQHKPVRQVAVSKLTVL